MSLKREPSSEPLGIACPGEGRAVMGPDSGRLPVVAGKYALGLELTGVPRS